MGPPLHNQTTYLHGTNETALVPLDTCLAKAACLLLGFKLGKTYKHRKCAEKSAQKIKYGAHIDFSCGPHHIGFESLHFPCTFRCTNSVFVTLLFSNSFFDVGIPTWGDLLGKGESGEYDEQYQHNGGNERDCNRGCEVLTEFVIVVAYLGPAEMRVPF